ncbi:hypothetical protein K2Q02_01635 [Patescibacteria group bacterium]|nr:hypothetical protein [Patescibacteria group bacterium]
MDHLITKLHTTLARSYFAYYLFSIVGLLADSIIGFDAPIRFGQTIAISCFILGPLLIVWAQRTSSHFRQRGEDTQHPYFIHGPYRLMRNPTHLGLVILVTGYAAISGSAIFLCLTVLGYIVSNMLFKRYELIITEKYGDHYTEYKKKVPKIL